MCFGGRSILSSRFSQALTLAPMRCRQPRTQNARTRAPASRDRGALPQRTPAAASARQQARRATLQTGHRALRLHCVVAPSSVPPATTGADCVFAITPIGQVSGCCWGGAALSVARASQKHAPKVPRARALSPESAAKGLAACETSALAGVHCERVDLSRIHARAGHAAARRVDFGVSQAAMSARRRAGECLARDRHTC